MITAQGRNDGKINLLNLMTLEKYSVVAFYPKQITIKNFNFI
jgi:hypothetical protein